MVNLVVPEILFGMQTTVVFLFTIFLMFQLISESELTKNDGSPIVFCKVYVILYLLPLIILDKG